MKITNEVDVGIEELEKTKIPMDRLSALTDGIFAIAMTILILSIVAPDSHSIASLGPMNNYIMVLLPQLGTYVVSFIIIGVFWLNHHLFVYVDDSDLGFTWLNLIWLLFVCMLPFSADFLSSFGQFGIAERVFGMNILLIELMFVFMSRYAMKHDMIRGDTAELKSFVRRGFLAVIIITVIVVALAFMDINAGFYLYLIFPFVTSLPVVSVHHKNE